VEEVWFVMRGSGTARVGSAELEIAARDFVFVGAGQEQGM
jgi:mannose-6-phosphate isomerase-like protein (cupin superfamily)